MKLSRRSRLILAAVLVVAIGAIGTALMLRSTGPTEVAPAAGENAAAAFEGGPDALLYLGGTTLQRILIAPQGTEIITELGSTQVVAAPGSELIAYVVAERIDEEDGAELQPVLHLFDPATEEDVELGPGFQPSWNALGTRLAYLQTTDAARCTTISCTSPSRIMLFDPATDESVPISEEDKWELGATWSGDRVLAAKVDDTERVFTFDTSGDEVVLDIPPSEVWGASPDGRWLVRVGRSGSEFVPLEDGEVSGEPVSIDVEVGTYLGPGRWAPDSSSIAAVVTKASRGDPRSIERKLGALLGLSLQRIDELVQKPLTQLDAYFEALLAQNPVKAAKARSLAEGYRAMLSAPDSSLALITPDDPSYSLVPGSTGVQATPLWGPDGDSLLFARLVDAESGLQQAFSCEVKVNGSCRLLFSWTKDVVLLRAE